MSRPVKYIFLALLIFFFLWKGVIPAFTIVHSDFANYYVAAQLVVEHAPLDSLYNNPWFQHQIKKQNIQTLGKFSPFPPISALILIPLTPFSPLGAQQIFTLINLLFLALTIWLTTKIINWPLLDSALLIFSFGLGLSNNVAFGQVYLIMTASLLLGWWLIPRKKIVTGLLIGFFTALKYFPLLIIGGFTLLSFPYFRSKGNDSWHHHQSVARWCLLFLLLFIGIQLSWFGLPLCVEFFNQTFLPHLNSNLEGQEPYSYYYQSWDALLRYAFVADLKFNHDPAINWPNGLWIGKLIIALVLVVSTGITLWRYKNSSVNRAVFISVPALAALVFLPVAATYHFILLLFPLIILIEVKLLHGNILTVIWMICFMIGFILYKWIIYLGENINFLLGFPRLWLMTALYFIVFQHLYVSFRKAATTT